MPPSLPLERVVLDDDHYHHQPKNHHPHTHPSHQDRNTDTHDQAHTHDHAHDHNHDHNHDRTHNHNHHSHNHDHHDHNHDHGHNHEHSHDHSHDHHHGHDNCTHDHSGWRQFAPHAHSIHTRLDADRRALLMALLILCTSLVAQLVGSVIASSQLLAVEAVHSAVDGVTVIISLIATVVARSQPTARYSFGYGRAEVLAALMSMTALALLCFKLALQAVGRIIGVLRGELTVKDVNGRIVVIAEAVTLCANILMAFVLRGHDSSLNVRAVRAHVIADSVENVFVLLAGMFMWAVKGAALLDSILTIIVVVILLVMNSSIAREVLDVLMLAAPPGMPRQLRERVIGVAGVARVDMLHIWTVTSGQIAASVRVAVAPMDAAKTLAVRARVATELGDMGVRDPCVEVVVANEGEDEVGDGDGDRAEWIRSPHSAPIEEVASLV